MVYARKRTRKRASTRTEKLSPAARLLQIQELSFTLTAHTVPYSILVRVLPSAGRRDDKLLRVLEVGPARLRHVHPLCGPAARHVVNARLLRRDRRVNQRLSREDRGGEGR